MPFTDWGDDWQNQPMGQRSSTPNTVLISVMWVLTGLQIVIAVATVGKGIAMCLMLDLPAIIIAIVLACSRNGTDKGNRWAKLALEAIACIFAAVATASARGY